MTLNIDDTATAELTVAESDLATALEQTAADGFPPVFATARMVGLMKLAASRLLHNELAEGELSVVVNVVVEHTAPTPLGAKVTATARYLGREDKFYLFEIKRCWRRDRCGHAQARYRLILKNSQRCRAALQSLIIFNVW